MKLIGMLCVTAVCTVGLGAQTRETETKSKVTVEDGKSVTVPNCDVLIFDGDLVRDWQIYIDLAPVFA